MGARPADFDEKLVRESPTFKKWELLSDGQKLRYACRDFIKGHGEDEERLMRRIMIARRNNLRDHEILKKARAQVEIAENANGNADSTDGNSSSNTNSIQSSNSNQNQSLKEGIRKDVDKINTDNDNTNNINPNPTKRRRCAASHSMTDDELRREMDTPAIEATRSYKAWLALPDGQEFTYNQKYIKGREGHDWLLRKNIWRRMRYRRHNKAMVEKVKNNNIDGVTGDSGINGISGISGFHGISSINSIDGINSMNGMPAVPSLPPVPAHPHTHSHLAAAVNEAAVTATQIVDHTLLAAAAAGAAAGGGNSASTTTTDTNINTSTDIPSIPSIPSIQVQVSENTTSNEDEENLHAAVVEAAVAAVAAAESYVKQARESEGAIGSCSTTTAAEIMKMEDSENINVDGNHLPSSVHNPIISDHHHQDPDALDDNHHHHHGHHGHVHTPNPLVNFDGDALDVAAKLAAAASVASVQVRKLENLDGGDDDEKQQCMGI